MVKCKKGICKYCAQISALKTGRNATQMTRLGDEALARDRNMTTAVATVTEVTTALFRARESKCGRTTQAISTRSVAGIRGQRATGRMRPFLLEIGGVHT